MINFRIGDTVTYRTIRNVIQTVRITMIDEIAFDGVTAHGEKVWGYNSDVLKVDDNPFKMRGWGYAEGTRLVIRRGAKKFTHDMKTVSPASRVRLVNLMNSKYVEKRIEFDCIAQTCTTYFSF